MTQPASPEEIAKALGQASPISGGWKCRCPGHDDKQSSLQITIRGIKDNRPVIYCHACGSGSEGRIYKEIEAQTGLHFKDRELPDNRTKKAKTLIIPATLPFPPNMSKTGIGPAHHLYEYHDENGKLCMVVGRWNTQPKKQIYPSVCVEQNGQPRWIWGLNGYRNKVCYNLPEIVQNPDKTVLVVEGEKAADAAKYIFPEYVVTTYQSGSSSWKHTNWECMKGRNIILWPDNDEPGKEHFLALAKYLNIEGFAKSVKMAWVPRTWPKGWDLADDMPGDLTDVRFEDAPKGGQEFFLQNTDASNYMETYDALYVLYHDGRSRHTLSKQRWHHQAGLPYGLDQKQTINTHHEAYRACVLKEGNTLQLWADAKMHNDEFVISETFAPGKGMIVEEYGRKKFNSFTGFPFNPVLEGSCEGFKNYILHILAGGDKFQYEYIFNYLSHMLQFPSDRPTVALVFKGVQGAGKSFLGRVISDMLGGPFGYAYRSQTVDSIAGKFNAQLASKLLIWVEELELTKSRAMENRLKSLITDKVVSIERKGVDAIQQINLARVMGSTNHEHIWNVDTNERRLSVFEVSDSKAKDQVYFGGIMKELENGGFGRLMYELLHYPVDHTLVNTPISNKAKAKQAVLTPEPARDLALKLLSSGDIRLRALDERRDITHAQYISEDDWRHGPQRLSTKVVRAVLAQMIESNKYGEKFTPRDKRIIPITVAKYLGGSGKYSPVTVTVGGEQVKDNGYQILELEAARHHFANEVGMDYDDLFDSMVSPEQDKVVPIRSDIL